MIIGTRVQYAGVYGIVKDIRTGRDGRIAYLLKLDDGGTYLVPSWLCDSVRVA